MGTVLNFAAAFDHVLEQEGGLVDHPDDPGGITNHGISIRLAGSIGLDVDGDGDTDADDIKVLTRDYAATVYREHFWDKCRCDTLPPALAFLVFDTAVNQGPRTAITILQDAVGAVTDGVIGPQTIARARERDGAAAVRDFIAWRALAYARTRKIETFGLGWFRRLAHAHRVALKELERGK